MSSCMSFIFLIPDFLKHLDSVHAGRNRAAVPASFDVAAGSRGKRRRKMVEAAFGEFAMECFCESPHLNIYV